MDEFFSTPHRREYHANAMQAVMKRAALAPTIMPARKSPLAAASRICSVGSGAVGEGNSRGRGIVEGGGHGKSKGGDGSTDDGGDVEGCGKVGGGLGGAIRFGRLTTMIWELDTPSAEARALGIMACVDNACEASADAESPWPTRVTAISAVDAPTSTLSSAADTFSKEATFVELIESKPSVTLELTWMI